MESIRHKREGKSPSRSRRKPHKAGTVTCWRSAKVLNVSRWTIYRLVEEDRLKATKIGKGSLRIFRDSIETLVEYNRKDNWGLVLADS